MSELPMRKRRGDSIFTPARERAPEFLRELFKDGAPEGPPHASIAKQPGSRIAGIQKLYLLYRYAQGYSMARVALELGISHSSARRIMRSARVDTQQTLSLAFIVQVSSGELVFYLCRYCGWSNADRPVTAMHAYDHLFNSDELVAAPLGA